VISHLGIVAGGVILPLVVYLSEGKKNTFVRHHAREALNFQLTFLIVYLCGFLLYGASIFLSVVRPDAFPGFFVPFSLLPLLWFGAVGFSIMGAVRASQQQWWRYPVAIRFLRPDHEG